MPEADVIIAGTGPAGLALGAACARRGLRVRCIGPAAGAPWTNTYALWLDEAEKCSVADMLSHRWDDAVIRTTSGERRAGRAYAQLDNAAVQARFRSVIEERGGRVDRGTLEDVVGGAAVVIDATGAGSRLPRVDGRAPGYQSAWGRVIETSGWTVGTATFMDWSPARCDADPRPTFLYALPIDEGRVFVEETSLVSAQPVPFELLAARLEARLESRGLPWRFAEGHAERCLFEMGTPPVRHDAPIAAFGAAAGYVHPATGYSVMRSLRLSERVADAVVDAVGADGSRDDRTRAINRAVWTDDERSAWQLYRYSMRVMMRFDGADLDAFFSAFFDLPPDLRGGFISGTLSAADVRRVMWSVFRRVPARLAVKLARGAFADDLGLLMPVRTF